jgi:ethanolamine ammonia-lyase small subunit
VPKNTPTRLTPAALTAARLGLGQTGPSIPTREHLRFQLDHAAARDAVHMPLDIALLQRGLTARKLPHVTLRSNAPDRATYLRRPDLGRTLHPTSTTALQSVAPPQKPGAPGPELRTRQGAPPNPTGHPTISFILADGLSAQALEHHALPLLDAVLALIPYACSLIPVALATNARVALGDEIGHLLHADITVLLIGERPGLSSPDSLGVYLTWNPRPGRTDAERNCISNIRGDAGLSYTEAAQRIVHYLTEANRLKTTGIALKDPASGVANPRILPL